MFDLQPNARIVIVGEQEGVSYGKPPQGCWKDIYLNEIKGKVDLQRIHFTGPLQYESYLKPKAIFSTCVSYLPFCS